MNSNTLISCFSLWVIVELISLLNTFFGGRILKKRYEMKRIYSTQLLFLLKKKGNECRLLEKLYVGLTNKSLRKILLKAIRKGSLKNQFAYIDKKIGCDIITLIHNHILHPIKSYEGLVKEVYDKLNIMELSVNQIKKTLIRNKLRLLLEKTIIMFINLALYHQLQNEYSLIIFIVVNTIGVIWFIVLDYESISVVLQFQERNLADAVRVKNKTQAPAYAVKRIFTTVAGLGLIINISMIAVGYLGLVI